jgi:hypothetical protein
MSLKEAETQEEAKEKMMEMMGGINKDVIYPHPTSEGKVEVVLVTEERHEVVGVLTAEEAHETSLLFEDAAKRAATTKLRL